MSEAAFKASGSCLHRELCGDVGRAARQRGRSVAPAEVAPGPDLGAVGAAPVFRLSVACEKFGVRRTTAVVQSGIWIFARTAAPNQVFTCSRVRRRRHSEPGAEEVPPAGARNS